MTTKSPVEHMDAIVKGALVSVAEALRDSSWTGRREREVVSLFCFGYLLRHCDPSAILSDPTQISIEVAVPQIPGQRLLTGKSSNKAQVCKDIVIWRNSRATCWDAAGRPTVRPLTVIEWKHNDGPISRYDTEWLCGFSSGDPDFVGYAISTNRPARGFALSCTRVFLGERTDNWVHII